MSSDAMVKYHKTARSLVGHGDQKTEFHVWNMSPRNHHLRSSEVICAQLRPEVGALF